MRLLSPLVRDVREYRLAIGRRAEKRLVLLDDHNKPWTRRLSRYCGSTDGPPPCRMAGLESVPRPYDRRHSFASLLLAEGHRPLYVARQLGHSLAVLLSTAAHLIDEFESSADIDAEKESARLAAQRVRF